MTPVQAELAAYLAALVLAGGTAAAAETQPRDTIRVRGNEACAACEIQLRRVTRLGEIDDPEGPPEFVSWVAVDAEGAFFVSPSITGAGFIRYSPTGAFDRVIGRRGEGPGEFGLPGVITVVGGDTLHVFDRRDFSRSVFLSDGTFLRRDPSHGVRVNSAVPLRDGSVVVAGALPTAEGIGFPAHWLDRDGTVRASFGAENPVVQPGQGRSTEWRREIGPAGDRLAVWLARPNRYELERWSARGTHELTVAREVDWFAGWPPEASATGAGGPRFDRPKPVTQGVWEDREGLLWVAVQVAASDWAPQGSRPLGPQPMPSFQELNQFYDLWIEAIDLEAMEVIAAVRVPHFYVQGTAGAGRLVRRTGDDTGMSYVEVWTVELLRP